MTRRRALFLQSGGGNDGQRRHRYHLTTRTGTRGEVYKSGGRSLFDVLRNSSPCFHVPFSVSNTALTQVTDKLRVGGVVLKPGRKNETVKRATSKN